VWIFGESVRWRSGQKVCDVAAVELDHAKGQKVTREMQVNSQRGGAEARNGCCLMLPAFFTTVRLQSLHQNVAFQSTVV
jgi:hypothetical protein